MYRTVVRHSYRALGAAAIVAALGIHSATRIEAQSGGITIAQCGSPCVLKAGPDFATDVMADPWDFSNREDVAIDPAQVTGISNFAMSNGIFSGTAVDSSGHFAVLEQPWNGIINPGKTGRKFPIDTTKYSKLAVRFNAGDNTRHPRVYWFHNDVGQGGAGWLFFDKDVQTPAGNGIYVIDLTQVNQNGINQGVPWASGAAEGLAFYPNDGGTPFTFQFDWVRLTTGDSAPGAANMTISWTGGGGDLTVTDGLNTVYTIAKAVASSGTFTWNYGVLPPGNYTLKVGAQSKTFTINSPPLLQVTAPSETGGADFATDVLKNPWDMSDPADVFHNVNIVPHILAGSESFTGIYTATSDGVAVATTTGGIPVGDPQVYLLSNQLTSNTTNIIDTTKYHRLTFDMTVDRAFDLERGSVGRVFWGSDSSDTRPGGTPYNVTTSKDIIMWPGKNSYTIDLATLTTANGGLELANATPWTQKAVRHFRIDPHEFAEQVTFHIDNVKLAADDETFQNSFTIKWNGTDADPLDAPTVTLYYQPLNGAPTLIKSGIAMSAGQYVWNTGGVPAGTYYILAQASDGVNDPVNRYSTGPVKVTTFTPASRPFIAVDTPTPSQTVTSAFEVGGWLLDAAAPTGTGTGVDDVDFFVQPQGSLAPGVHIGHGRLGLPRSDIGAIFGSQFANSGFHFTITGMSPGQGYTLGVYGHSTVTNAYTIVKTVPFNVSATGLMSVDVPSPELTIATPTFGVGGWAIDRSVEQTTLPGTGVDSVVVYAYPNPGSGQPAIFLGVASYGTIQRSDVAGIYGSRYQNSGYGFTVDRAARGLTPGVYNIVPIAHSSVSNSYNNLAIVQVILQ